MKPLILLLAVSVTILSSCSTAYKTGQTPDDVYYSPVRPQDDYDRTEEQKDQTASRNDEQYYDDRYLRMKVHNRTRWSELDDWYYYGNRYNYTSYNCACVCENPWTPYSYWNNHYNPYYSNHVIINPKSITYSKPRTFNLNAYNTQMITNSNYTNPKSSTPSTYTAPRNKTTADDSRYKGSFLREIFNKSSDNSSSSSSNSNSSSSSSNSNSNSSSGSSNTKSTSNSSSSSSSAPVRRF
jgi:hypothetical protein